MKSFRKYRKSGNDADAVKVNKINHEVDKQRKVARWRAKYVGKKAIRKTSARISGWREVCPKSDEKWLR